MVGLHGVKIKTMVEKIFDKIKETYPKITKYYYDMCKMFVITDLYDNYYNKLKCAKDKLLDKYPQLVYYGICAEYCILNGNYAEAYEWNIKYQNYIKNINN